MLKTDPLTLSEKEDEQSGKGNEKWALKMDLPPGEYEFKFVVDGNWIHDELKPAKTNEMGTKNNFIVVQKGIQDRSK